MSGFVYYDKLEQFATTYLVKGNEYLIKDPRNFQKDYDNIKNEIGEKLLYHDGIAIKVYGENIPLAILINTFGVKGVEELIEQGAIQFVLWTPLITYLQDDIKGLMPLQCGTFNSKVNIDPEESATLGLGWMKNQLPRKVRRNLIRKVCKVYKITPNKLSNDSVKFGHEGYESNLFADFGLPKDKDIMDLNRDERKKLCDFATQCAQLAILSECNYDSLELFDVAKINSKEVRRLKDLKAVENNADKLFDLERVPNFNMLIKDGLINLEDIPKLRGKKDSKRFREWISKAGSNENNYDIVNEYIDAITNGKGFFETKTGKLIKILSVSAVSGTIGASIGGLQGAICGISMEKIAEQGVDLGLSLLDTYVLDGMLKGWTPRHYFDKSIKPLVNKIEQF